MCHNWRLLQVSSLYARENFIGSSFIRSTRPISANNKRGLCSTNNTHKPIPTERYDAADDDKMARKMNQLTPDIVDHCASHTVSFVQAYAILFYTTLTLLSSAFSNRPTDVSS